MGNAYFVKPLDWAAITALYTATGTAASDLGNNWIGVQYRGVVTTGNEQLTIDFGSAAAIDTIAILASNGTAGGVTFKAAATSGGLASPAFTDSITPFAAGSVTPVSGRTHALYQAASVQAYRWWEIDPFGITGGPWEAGRLVMGSKIQLARNFEFGGSFGVVDRGGGDFSQSGVWLPKPGAIMRTINISFTRATKEEAEAVLGPLLERIGNSGFLLLVVNGDADPQRQRRMYFGPLQGQLETLWRVANGWQWRVSMTSVI